MRTRRWFLPEEPDVLGLLRGQCAIVIDGLGAFTRWASGETAAAGDVADAERRGDGAKRELLEALRTAFVLPLEPEDAFTLSRSVDRVISAAREIVVESEVLDCPPDAGIVAMSRILERAMGYIDDAIAHVGDDHDRATASADAALEACRELDGAYYRGMAALLGLEDRSARIGSRELYRRCARIGDVVSDAAERVVYSVVKQS